MAETTHLFNPMSERPYHLELCAITFKSPCYQPFIYPERDLSFHVDYCLSSENVVNTSVSQKFTKF